MTISHRLPSDPYASRWQIRIAKSAKRVQSTLYILYTLCARGISPSRLFASDSGFLSSLLLRLCSHSPDSRSHYLPRRGLFELIRSILPSSAFALYVCSLRKILVDYLLFGNSNAVNVENCLAFIYLFAIRLLVKSY